MGVFVGDVADHDGCPVVFGVDVDGELVEVVHGLELSLWLVHFLQHLLLVEELLVRREVHLALKVLFQVTVAQLVGDV